MYFTDKIAAYIQENQLDPKHLTIVLPSERAIKYISASLFRANGKPMLAPEMVTIDRWVKSHSERTVIDRTRLLVRLFAVQMEQPADPKDASFDEFMTWGSILLNDYDEIDRYLLSSEEVFKNLADIKEIESWSFNSEELTPAQQRFMEFWDRLPGYYRRLNEILKQEGVCYMGLAYRSLAENIDKLFQKDSKRIYLFAGFNALSKAELSIMKQLHVMGRGHILIDADSYYMDSPVHEAGMFMKNMLKELVIKELPFVTNNLLTQAKDITVIECVQHTGQVKAAASILAEMSKEDIDQTLILLADEGLIVPLLRNIPGKVGKANITLGLPLRTTAIRTWMDILFNIQENKVRFKTESVYFQDLQKLWNHPFVTAIITKEEMNSLTEMELDAVRKNKIFRNKQSVPVSPKIDALLDMATENWQNDWTKALSLIRSLSRFIHGHLQEADEFNKALIEGFDQSIVDFENILHEGIPAMSIRSFKNLLQQHWMNKSIAYHGNPIKGLQIMGLLETRLLDFKNIIVLGLNEGKMPPTNPIQTMIPLDLRAYLKLPTPRDKQGLFAHHFYRLLHQSEKMWITYSSAKESIGSNEASRYLLQLELELRRRNSLINWSKLLYSIPEEKLILNEHRIVQKSPEILDRMDQLFQESVSASALNKYLSCPLDFYYRYVLGFGEVKEIEEDVESSSLGTFIHAVLEELYEPFARHDKQGILKTIQPSAITSYDIDRMLKEFPMYLENEFLNHFNKDKAAFSSGKNLLSFQMANELTKRFLESEREFLLKQTEPVFIEYLEVELIEPIELEINGSKKSFKLKGLIDRVDSIGGKIRIVDYKSGKVKDEDVFVKIGKSDDDYYKKFTTTKHALQLTMYSYLYRSRYGVLPTEVGIYSLINISNGFFALDTNKGMTLEEITEAFPEVLQELFSEMYDTEIPFEHTIQQFSYCNYCK